MGPSTAEAVIERLGLVARCPASDSVEAVVQYRAGRCYLLLDARELLSDSIAQLFADLVRLASGHAKYTHDCPSKLLRIVRPLRVHFRGFRKLFVDLAVLQEFYSSGIAVSWYHLIDKSDVLTIDQRVDDLVTPIKRGSGNRHQY